MKFTTSTVLSKLLLAQALVYGDAKGKKEKYHSESSYGKGKGYMSSSSSGKGKGYSSDSGKGKGGYSDDDYKGDYKKCMGALKALDDALKVTGILGMDMPDPGPVGMRLFFSDHELSRDGERVGSISGQCTAIDAEMQYYCLASITIGEYGTIIHQGTLNGDEEAFLNDSLVITGGFDCYEGIVGTTSIVATSDPVGMEWEFYVEFDARLL
jgi:hypothetical protein